MPSSSTGTATARAPIEPRTLSAPVYVGVPALEERVEDELDRLLRPVGDQQVLRIDV
jgi:hypothetical protein